MHAQWVAALWRVIHGSPSSNSLRSQMLKTKKKLLNKQELIALKELFLLKHTQTRTYWQHFCSFSAFFPPLFPPVAGIKHSRSRSPSGLSPQSQVESFESFPFRDVEKWIVLSQFRIPTILLHVSDFSWALSDAGSHVLVIAEFHCSSWIPNFVFFQHHLYISVSEKMGFLPKHLMVEHHFPPIPSGNLT